MLTLPHTESVYRRLPVGVVRVHEMDEDCPMTFPVRGLAATLLLVACLARSAGACEMTRLATVPLMVADGRILVALEINGHEATFQLDTGAARSVVTPEAVHRLGLPRDRWVGSTIGGIGGIERRSVADTTSLTLAGIALRHRDAARDRCSRSSCSARRRAGGRIIDGLLGRDFLSEFDVALDVGARTMTLWRVQGCAGRFLPGSASGAAPTTRSPRCRRTAMRSS